MLAETLPSLLILVSISMCVCVYARVGCEVVWVLNILVALMQRSSLYTHTHAHIEILHQQSVSLISIYIDVYIHVYIHVCVYVCVCVCVYIYYVGRVSP